MADLVDVAVGNSLGGIGLWRHVYADIGVHQASRMITSAGLAVTSVCRAGMFPTASDVNARATRDDNVRAVDEAHALGAECLVVVCGAAATPDLNAARRHVEDGLSDLARYAATAGVSLAVEPMHPMMIADRSVVTSLSEAVDLVERTADPRVGVALDAYHVFWDVDYPREAMRASGRIHTVQISDWTVPIHHQLRSRGMPGEGVIDLRGFMAIVRAAGFRGLVEVEVLSDRWAAVPPQVAVDAMVQGVATL
ncbi:sugar phosphate isomerase/epimerase family protein [Mycobacterium yunnanensis]|uniref:sugar phosphate isomerase/epimerase family protein n=1 Tax=Mycobacterium yunnanensis TaxID=368477 RepID=UPI0021F31FD9|nr:sugar phosphate isomerase/epimerase family protein [Mycobacterium yunnanensis]